MNSRQSEQLLGKTVTRTLFIIGCQSGRNVRGHSMYPGENEVLPPAQFKVVACLDQGERRIIPLEKTSNASTYPCYFGDDRMDRPFSITHYCLRMI